MGKNAQNRNIMIKIKHKELIIKIPHNAPAEVLEGINLGICTVLQTLSESEDLYYNPDLFDAMYYLIELQKALISTKKADKEE